MQVQVQEQVNVLFVIKIGIDFRISISGMLNFISFIQINISINPFFQ